MVQIVDFKSRERLEEQEYLTEIEQAIAELDVALFLNYLEFTDIVGQLKPLMFERELLTGRPQIGAQLPLDFGDKNA